MKLVIYKNSKPIYEQLYEQISSQIITGEIKAEECLPSIRVLARELTISVITVKTAYDMLEKSGFIYTQAGRGCFVAPHSQSQLGDKQLSIAQEKLQEILPYFKTLGITYDELIDMIKKLY